MSQPKKNTNLIETIARLRNQALEASSTDMVAYGVAKKHDGWLAGVR